MKQKILILFAIVLIFFGLVAYNYFKAQKEIEETRPSPLEISLMSYPERVVVGQNGSFVWNVDSSPDLYTPQTTIYWGFTATPSALSKYDSPQAVGYPYSEPDYMQGIFKLPDSFDISIPFIKTGKVYFRAYAKVGDNHLWTDEKTLEIISTP